ncbi:MAG TPA: lasso peptide biosynthesis B2 protein [Caldilineae bacterium]|nr:lasso peptide biosynthesis B2 protein [Caldilineae bacterium]
MNAWWALSWPDRVGIGQAWVLLLVADLSLRLLPFPLARRVIAIGRSCQDTLSPEETAALIKRWRRLVNIAASHHLYPMQCLRRAIVLRWLLSRYGIRADVCIGIRKTDDGYHTHAWVEQAGRPISEPESHVREFLPLMQL